MESEKKPEERAAENLSTLKQELENKTSEANKSIEEKEALVSEVEDLELDCTSTGIESLIWKVSLEEHLQKKTAEISTLREKLVLAESEIARLGTMQKEAEEEKRELSRHFEMLETSAKEITKLSQMQKDAEEEKTSLSSKISQLEDDKKQAENNIQILVTESGKLRKRLEEKERELEKEEFLMQIETLKQELENKYSEDKRNTEETKTLLLQIKDLILDLDSTRDQKLEPEKELKGKSQELSKSLTREETSERETDKRTPENQEIIDTLLKEINSIRNQKHKVEEELKNKTAKLEILEAKELMRSVTEIGKASEESLHRLNNARRVIGIESSQEQMEFLQSEKSQLEIEIERRTKELNSLFEKFPNTDELLSKKEEEVKVLQDKLASISVQVTKVVLSDTMTGMDAFCRKFEEGYGNLNSRVNEIAEIVNKIKMSEDELIEMERKMIEKDEEVESLKEEKRQVIRQLCSFIEYYREYGKQLEEELEGK